MPRHASVWRGTGKGSPQRSSRASESCVRGERIDVLIPNRGGKRTLPARAPADFLSVHRVTLDRFDPRANGLNLFRLLLAVSVIVWHSFPLTGRSVGWAPLEQLMGEIGV